MKNFRPYSEWQKKHSTSYPNGSKTCRKRKSISFSAKLTVQVLFPSPPLYACKFFVGLTYIHPAQPTFLGHHAWTTYVEFCINFWLCDGVSVKSDFFSCLIFGYYCMSLDPQIGVLMASGRFKFFDLVGEIFFFFLFLRLILFSYLLIKRV